MSKQKVDAILSRLIMARFFYATIRTVCNSLLLIVLLQLLSATFGYGQWNDLPIAVVVIFTYAMLWRTRVLLLAEYHTLLTADWHKARWAIEVSFGEANAEHHANITKEEDYARNHHI